MLHAKVNAVVLLRFVNEEIFQRIVAVGWGKRFFADLAVNRTCRMWQLRPHANELISRCALRTKEISSFGHETPASVRSQNRGFDAILTRHGSSLRQTADTGGKNLQAVDVKASCNPSPSDANGARYSPAR